MSPKITILGRAWCHLCHDMELALRRLLPGELEIEMVELEDDTPLEQRWGEWIPVLMIDGEYVCHYHLDEAAVCAKLGGFPVTSSS